jgi:hypothetical protein
VVRRLSIAIGLLLAAPLIGVPGWIAAHRSDLPFPGDADLAVIRSELAPGENGFEAFVSAAQRIDWPSDGDHRIDRIRRGEARDARFVREIVARNAAAMADLRRGLDAPAFRFPPDDAAEALDRQLGVLIPVQRLVRLAGAEARLRLAAGDREAAIEQAFLGMRVGQALGRAEGVELVGMMFAASSRSIGLADLEAIAREIPFDAEAAYALTSRLEAHRWSADDWGRMWAAEYERLKASLLEVGIDDAELLSEDEGGRAMSWAWRWIPSDYLWQPNRTLASLAATYRSRQRRSGLDCRTSDAAEPSEEPRRWRMARALLAPNPAGRLALEIGTPNLDRFERRRCHLDTRVSLLQALIAARAYWHARGELPQRLDDLVPVYLADVPRDRFSGGPLRYAPARRVAYSVGEDHLDAGGGEAPSPSEASEPAISLAF